MVQSGHEDPANIIEENTKQVIPGMKTQFLTEKPKPVNGEAEISDEISLMQNMHSDQSCETLGLFKVDIYGSDWSKVVSD